MSEDSRFKVSLPFHPAFKSTVPVPVALLKHFRDVGLTVHTLVYTLQAFAVYMNGGEISHFEIALRMGVDERIIRRYVQVLRDAGFLLVNHQRDPRGMQAVSDYDFSPLLDAVTAFYQPQPETQTDAEVRQVLAELAYAIENSLPLNDVLKRRVLALVGGPDQTIREIGSIDPPNRIKRSENSDQLIRQTGSNDPDQTIREVGSNDPPLSDQLIRQTGSNDPPSDDDDLLSSSVVENHHHQPSEGNNPISALVSIGFTKVDASLLVYKVMSVFGDSLDEVVMGWVAYARENKRVMNPPGFVRVKLERGEYPPAPLVDGACPKCQRPMPSGQCLFCAGVIQT